MNEFLNKIEEMVTHNAMCYSKDFMQTPKEGYEKEFAAAYHEMALIAKLKEIVADYYGKTTIKHVDQYKSTKEEYIEEQVQIYTSENPDEWEDWGDITGGVMARCSVTGEDVEDILHRIDERATEIHKERGI